MMPERIDLKPKYIDVNQVHIPKGFFNNLNVPKLYDWLESQPTANVAEIVMCKDCIHAIEHKYSPAFYKCTGCSFLRGRLVSSTFWCKCGEKKEKTK